MIRKTVELFGAITIAVASFVAGAYVVRLADNRTIAAEAHDLLATVAVSECKMLAGVVVITRDGVVHGLQPKDLTDQRMKEIDALPESHTMFVTVPCGQQL